MKQAVTTQLDNWKLGSTSTRFETAGKGVFAISSGKGDNGGASYGAYQLSSRTETLSNFLKSTAHGGYGKQFAGLVPGTEAFNAKWLELARNDTAFARHQHQFIHDTHYEAQLKFLAGRGLNLSERGAAIHDMVWSTSVQFGGATSVVSNALQARYGSGVKVSSLSDADIINAVQDYKVQHNATLFAKSSEAVRAGTLKRANAERDKLMELVGLENVARSSPAGGKTLVETVAPTVNDTGISMCAQTLPGDDFGFAWCVMEEQVKGGLFSGSQTRTSLTLRDESTGRAIASVCTADDIMLADSVLSLQNKIGQISSEAYAFWSNWSTTQLLGNTLKLIAGTSLGGLLTGGGNKVSGGGTPGGSSSGNSLTGSSSLSLLPIGAFYESRSLTHDDAASITIAAYPQGKGSGSTDIRALAASAMALGNAPNWQTETPSDFVRLRSTDNVFVINGSQFIRWEPHQIKLMSDRRTLVGTDNADVFDINYYAAYDGRYFSLSAVNAFHAGGGDDSMGGSARNDSLWGGTGKDTLFGYEGDDSIFGQSGDDFLLGQNGRDWLHGGEGSDLLGGGVGSDTLYGGAGSDELQGGEDNDLLDGADGDDLLLGESGHDTLLGADGRDELQGGDGNDALAGEAGDDRLFGQLGNDSLHGGDGNDLLMGFKGNNEANQGLSSDQSDNDWLYGGAGTDTLLGGVGDDWLDGGGGADQMEGGSGNDDYLVNSVNDVVLEQADEGVDSVYSSVSSLLAANIENLTLLEGFKIHGTGNARNNRIVGNSSDNILDGVTGADTLEGGDGNDIYYVDNAADTVLEASNKGSDTVYSSIHYALGANLENLTLLDFSKPEKGLIDGVDVLVYGYPKANELDYMQGNAVTGFRGTCALTSIANLATQGKIGLTEQQVVQRAIEQRWCVADTNAPDYRKGGSNHLEQQALLSSFGLRNGLVAGYDELALANLIRGGRGVIMAMNAGQLWNDDRYRDNGAANHVVTLTGVACRARDGSIEGFYIADSGRGLVSDMTRYLSLTDFRAAANVASAYSIYSQEPIKLWNENINASGNSLSNQIVGNRGINRLSGGRGNDTLNGLTGDDTYVFARGDGRDLITDSDSARGNVDTLQFSDIHQTQLWFSRSGSNLQIRVLGGNDSITVRDWYVPGGSGSDNHIERIQTADGLTLFNTDINRFVEAMAAFPPPSVSQSAWRPGDSSNGKVLFTVNH